MKWKPGQSGNPGGRPKHGNGLAEVIRKKLDPEIVFEKLLKIAETSPSEQTQLRALELLMERGWKKPAQVVEVGPADPYEDLSDAELEALEAHEQAVLAGGGALALGVGEEPASIVLDAESYDAFAADMANPAPPNERLRALMVGQGVVSPTSGVVSEARAPLLEAPGADSRTTSHPVGKGGSVQVRKRVYPEDEDTDI